VFVITVND